MKPATPPAAPTAADPKQVEAFVGKVLEQASGTTLVLMAGLGDRLGLFKDLALHGPATSEELAKRTGVHERYAREWLGMMGSGGYLAYDPASRRFRLPAEHAPALAQEGGPLFFGGVFSMLAHGTQVLPQVEQAFRRGGGVAQGAYPPGFYDDMDRFTSNWHNNMLLQQWLPLLPHVQERLQQGIAVCDVGCGRGRALVNLAKAFPRSTYVGFDAFEPNVQHARRLAKDAGVQDRVRIEVLDAAKPLPGKYDLVTTFDVIHDAADPRGILRSIRGALKPGGSYLNLDINCSDKLEENAGPLGTLFHGFSLMYCMTTSLAAGGAALGTLGVPESKLRELGTEAGFQGVRRVPMENPFNNLYELTI